MPQDKEYLLKEQEAAATYQGKLTAGRNINISENNVISSPDPPPPGSTVTVTPNQMSGNLIATVTVDSNSYNLYSPIPPVMTGATSGVRGEQGLVPAPSIGYQDYVLYGDGTWKDPEIPNIIANPAVSATIDLTKIYIDGTVYGVSGGGGSSDFEAVEISKASYDLLPTSEKTDQDKIYMVYGEDNFENINFKQGILHNEYAMSTTLKQTQASFAWNGGANIGSEIRFNTPIDITNIDKISYSLTTTTCYGHNNANVEEQENQRFHIRVLLFDTMIPASDWEADHLNDQSLLTYNSHIYTNTTYTNDECVIDTSNLTGNVYLIVSAAGWNCTFTNLQLHMNGHIEKKRINWNDKTWGANFDSVKISYNDYINLPLAKKEDVSKIYMVSQPKLNYLNMLEVTKIETTDAPIYPISKNEIDFTYSSGNGPGQWLYFNDAIDVTNIDKIYYSMVTGDNYDTLNSQDNNQRYLAVGLKSTTTSSWAAPYNMGYTLYNEYDNEYTNSTLNDEYLDVSQLTGEYYLTISGVGWNIVFTDIGTLSSSPEYENMIYWNNKCFSNASNGLKYWQETPQRFYRDYYVDGLSADEGYKLTEMMCAQWTSYDTANGYLYRKKNNEPAVMACLTNNYSYGDNRRYVFVAKTATAVDWEWATCRPSTDPFIPTSDWGAKETYPLVPTQYPTYPFGWQTTTIEYGGDTWYVMGIQPPYSDSTLQYRSNEMLTLYMGNVSSATITELGQFVLENLHVTGRIDAQISIGANDNVFQWTIDGENIAWINKDGTSSFDKEEEVVPLTQDEYDALPSSKLTDNKIYFISETKELDSNYNYYKYGENDEIVVKVYHEGESDETIKWYFRNWNQTSGDMAIPSSLLTYAPTNLSPIYSANYPNGGETQDGWIGFFNNNIRAWIQSTGDTTTGRMYGVVDINEGARQTNPYEDDPYVWVTSSINKIIVNGTEYGNTGGGTEVTPNPTGVATEGLTKIEIDGTIYSIDGGVPIEEEDIDPNDFVNNYQSSMNISVDSTTNKLTYQWSSGTLIGTCSVLNYPIDLSIYTGAKVKITTGATAYSTTEFYGINVGVRSGYSTNYLGTTSTGWILQETFYDLNSTVTYAFDFSTLTGMDNYFYICGGGWNFVVDEIIFYKKGEGNKVIPNPQDQPTDTLTSIKINDITYSIEGGGSGETTKYYVTDGFLSDGTNRQFITVQLNEALTEGRGYIIAFKNEANGQIIAKSFFDYINDYNVTIGTASSIGNITLNITSTSISSTDYSGPWQDIYIDVYRTASEGGSIIDPNPSGEPTDTLDSIKIDDTVYSIPGALQPITLTAAQYEALPSSEKMDGSKIYFVTDE